jgi:hypothetical protein
MVTQEHAGTGFLRVLFLGKLLQESEAGKSYTFPGNSLLCQFARMLKLCHEGF